MMIDDLLRERNMTRYRLAVTAGIPHATLNDICSGKTRLEKCSAETVYKLAKALGVSTEYLKVDSVEDCREGADRMEYVEEIRKQTGYRESLDLEVMLKENQALFAGGTISEEAKDAYFQAVMQAYVECKKAAQEKFGRKKEPFQK